VKIQINISNKDINHLENCMSEIDACGYVEDVIRKVKKAIRKEKSLRKV
jgi:hypothetical protein